MIVVFDTETTGIALKQESHLDPRQPHIASVAAVAYTPAWEEIHSVHLFVKPDGWVMPEEATAVHGITQEFLEWYGIDLDAVLTPLDFLFHNADQIWAFGMKFDKQLYGIECARRERTDWLAPQKTHCAMQLMAGILKIPGQYGDYKWPSLVDSYHALFGCGFEKAHDGLADVRATAAILREVTSRPDVYGV